MSPLEWTSFSINVAIMVTALSYAVFCDQTTPFHSSHHRTLAKLIGRIIRLLGLFSLSTIALYFILLVGISALIGL